MNKFKIICPSYNNEKWVETHISSILGQTYDNWEVIYIDDNSSDNTWKAVNDLVGNNSKFRLIRNSENKGAAYNYNEYLENIEDEDILIHLDGDDWIATPDVLEKLNNLYLEKDLWMSYGYYMTYKTHDDIEYKPFPQNTEYPEFVHRYSKYRVDHWRASHMRTYKWFLYKNIDRNDLKSNIDGKYFWHASDLSWAYPCLEMCPKEKIGVLDFPSYMVNRAEGQAERTQERESADNTKYEVEIRNKKKYKREYTKKDLHGEKLPLVNSFSNSKEYNHIPTKFSYCYGLRDGDFDMVIFDDDRVYKYLDGSININKNVPIVVRLYEQRSYFQNKLYDSIIKNYEKFHTILTFDKQLLDLLPNAKFATVTDITQFNMLPNEANHPQYKPEGLDSYELPELKIYNKTKFNAASCIASSKSFLPGHKERLNFVQHIKDRVDLYGRGIREIPSKLDALKNHAFSVAIENNTDVNDYYFTEKLTDCLITGTVPIYHGCPNIGEFFDMDGILTFSTQDELDNILKSLSEEKYNSMKVAIENNYKKCLDLCILHNDDLYDKFFESIIKG